MNRGQVCVEVALNGAWTRRVQPRMPITPDEIIAEAVACAEAGASVVHFHAYDATGEQTTEPEVLAHIIEGIRARADVIAYPTIRYLTNAQQIGPGAGALRNDHTQWLAERGLLEWMVIDPGSFNLVSTRDVQQRKPGAVDINPPDAIRHAMTIAAKHRLHPGFAIYEPGYLRLAAALCKAAGDNMPAPLYRLMFSNQFTFGFPPTALALRAYLALLADVAPDAPWMVAGLGVDLRALIPMAVELGGHVRVGLEDWTLGASETNLELVTQAVQRIAQAGGSVAGAADVRRGLFAQPARVST